MIITHHVAIIGPDPSSSDCPYKVYNIGNSSLVNLMKFIEIIEQRLGITSKKKFMPIQPSDVKINYAEVSDLIEFTGYKPNTDIEYGY